MKNLLLVAFGALTLMPQFATAEDEHPYKKAKIGDFVTFKATYSANGKKLAVTVTNVVTEITDKEVTLKQTSQTLDDDKEKLRSTQTLVIDTTKPLGHDGDTFFSSAKLKIEKLKEGKEKIKIGDKDFETTWMTYKSTGEGKDIKGEHKIWFAKEVIGGVVKIEVKLKNENVDIIAQIEYLKHGNMKQK